MLLLSFTLALVVGAGHPAEAMPVGKERPSAPRILIHTPSGWSLDLRPDGSGRVQYGSSGHDGWSFPAGTFETRRVEADLRKLESASRGSRRTHFTFRLPSDGPDSGESPSARYTRDLRVIPALLQKALRASESRIDPERKAMLARKHPPGRLE